MNCPACGTEVDADDAFCRKCGKRFQTAEGPRSATVDEMAAEYRQSLAEKPDDPDSLYNVGLACLYSGDYADAAEAFRAVVRLLPEEAAGHEKLAVSLAKLGRREEGLTHAREAHRLDPRRPSVRRLLEALSG